MNAQQAIDLLHRIVRFGVVGILNNLGGYLLFLLITALGVDPKLTVAVFYPLALLINYLTHAKYSFRHHNIDVRTGLRFVAVNGVGLLTNILLLYVFVDRLHYRHEIVQLVAIFVVGFELFFLNSLFVFRGQAAEPHESTAPLQDLSSGSAEGPRAADADARGPAAP
ncbi:GtrA family protein [Tardiphaga sp. vice352]|uniref:GtrA family protein n=1 Tax=Tardiphaga sp. vice352 TaxID=2592816 RepID=UPI0011623446|nr:GtrA family protein [Tardiphaga sp. vice352]QDM33302.1 GtrA family protein [Tardiphaga sp. vice352]